MLGRQRQSVDLAGEEHLAAHGLGQVDRPAEAEPLALPLHAIEADQLDMPGAVLHPDGVEEVAKRTPPLHSAVPAASGPQGSSPGSGPSDRYSARRMPAHTSVAVASPGSGKARARLRSE